MRSIFLFLFVLIPFLSTAQHQDKVDFISADVIIQPNPREKLINGTVVYKFKALQNVDSIFLNSKNMVFSNVSLNSKKIRYTNDGEKITVKREFKKGKEYELGLIYSCIPKQTVYFLGWDDKIEGNEQIWTQGQGKYTSHWLPSFDDMEEKIIFDLDVVVDENFTVVANGDLDIALNGNKDKTKDWFFSMQKPISSYLLAFAIGNYDKQELKSASCIPIENYYYPQDSLKVEPTFRYTKEIFDFLEEEIGFSYPWQNYKQIPVRDFLYAGMENTTATIFSDGYVIDSTAFVDKNYVNVNAHELAHQWFGNLVTEKNGNHHWLHEGFATYYAQLAEKEIFGDDHYYWKLYSSLQQLEEGVEREEGKALTDPKASSLVFYEKGAWALFMLRHQIGDDAFRKGIQNYLEKYKFKNVTISDFLTEMETASGSDLKDFNRDWLENVQFPIEEAKDVLAEKSAAIKLWFEFELDMVTFQEGAVNYNKYWDSNTSIHLRKQMLEQYYTSIPIAMYAKTFSSDTIPIRQTIARKTDSIPTEFKTAFESLLDDQSYVTIENALYSLWVSYPGERIRYLDQTANTIGLPNKNVRLLWLTLAMVTNGYNTRNTPTYFKELSGYTSKEYGWEVRMGAFQYLHQALGLNDETLKNLINASVHHSWQFKKYARNLLQVLLKDEEYKARLIAITKELKGEEKRYMNTKLKE